MRIFFVVKINTYTTAWCQFVLKNNVAQVSYIYLIPFSISNYLSNVIGTLFHNVNANVKKKKKKHFAREVNGFK